VTRKIRKFLLMAFGTNDTILTAIRFTSHQVYESFQGSKKLYYSGKGSRISICDFSLIFIVIPSSIFN
jgi:hypothetical protein